jgi:hypothetical protein
MMMISLQVTSNEAPIFVLLLSPTLLNHPLRRYHRLTHSYVYISEDEHRLLSSRSTLPQLSSWLLTSVRVRRGKRRRVLSPNGLEATSPKTMLKFKFIQKFVSERREAHGTSLPVDWKASQSTNCRAGKGMEVTSSWRFHS